MLEIKTCLTLRLDPLETDKNQMIESFDFVSKDIEDLENEYREL